MHVWGKISKQFKNKCPKYKTPKSLRYEDIKVQILREKVVSSIDQRSRTQESFHRICYTKIWGQGRDFIPWKKEWKAKQTILTVIVKGKEKKGLSPTNDVGRKESKPHTKFEGGRTEYSNKIIGQTHLEENGTDQ